MAKKSKYRSYSTIVYPDCINTPDNWIEILEQEKIPTIISPLHKDDVNADGEPKKPHYHVNIYFDNPRSVNSAQKIFDKIGAVGCETINSVRGATRYLIHMDNPDKAQYDRNDVVCLNGADFNALVSLPTDDIKIVREMLVFIQNNLMTSFNQFVDYCAENNDEWFKLLITSKSFFIKEYIKSFAWDIKQQENNDM